MIRDQNTMALLNTDFNALSKYKEQKKQHKQMNSILEDIEDLRKITMNILSRIEIIEEKL